MSEGVAALWPSAKLHEFEIGQGVRVKLDRRQWLSGAAACLTTLRTSPVSASGRRFAPEEFGAVGDGIKDDYDALSQLVAAINAAGGGTIVLRGGRHYRIDRYSGGGHDAVDLTFAGCRGLTLLGNGAKISLKGDFVRDVPQTRGLCGLRFEDCTQVLIRDVELDGNVERTFRATKASEPPTHGLAFQSCTDVSIDGAFVHHFACDGMLIRESKRPGGAGTRLASRGFAVRNSRFMFNARQGLTVSQLRGGYFENCDFSYSGYIDEEGRLGPYGGHSPAAGVDVEPDNTPSHGNRVDVLTGDLLFRSCRFIGNYGATFLASKALPAKRFLDDVILDSSHLECNEGLSGGQDGFIFDVPAGAVTNCTLQMKDKTAYVGWYRASDASPRFANNKVLGRNSGKKPVFVVRQTGGAPVIENNEFSGQQREAKPAGGFKSAIVYVDNDNATFRKNRVFLPAAAFPTGVRSAIGAYLNAGRLGQNSFETDLRAKNGIRYFVVAYARSGPGAGDAFRGIKGAPPNSVQHAVMTPRAS